MCFGKGRGEERRQRKGWQGREAVKNEVRQRDGARVHVIWLSCCEEKEKCGIWHEEEGKENERKRKRCGRDEKMRKQRIEGK